MLESNYITHTKTVSSSLTPLPWRQLPCIYVAYKGDREDNWLDVGFSLAHELCELQHNETNTQH